MGRVLSEPYAGLWGEFLAYERQRRSAQGFQGIQKTSYQLLKWFEGQDLRPEKATVQDALEYKAAAANRATKEGAPVAVGTCCNSIKAGRAFFSYMVMSGRRDSNPFMAVSYPRIPSRIGRNVLSESQMDALLERLRQFTTAEQYKAHVIAELMYASGLRIAEAASLLPTDIDTRQRLVYIREGKGGKSRTAFLTGYAADVLYRYRTQGRNLALSSYRGKRPQGHTLFGVGLSRLQEEINEALREACRELELPVITSHGFRHSLGTHLLRAGCDIRHIQVILGHEKLETTQIYTQVDKDDIKKCLDVYHPRKEGRI